MSMGTLAQYGSTCMPRTNLSFFLFDPPVDFSFPKVFSTQNVEEAGGDCSLELFEEKTLVEVIYCEIWLCT